MTNKIRDSFKLLGLWFAVLGYFLGDTLTWKFYQSIDKLVGNSLPVDKIESFGYLYKYRTYMVILIVIVFWTFGTCIGLLLNEIGTEKEKQI